VKHSHLGASGAERWIKCPGSTAMLRHACIQHDTDEPSYRADGTCAHAGALWCLLNGADAWEAMGQEFEGGVFGEDHARGVQVYLDTVRADIGPDSRVFYEQTIADPAVHAAYFGTVDCAVLNDTTLIVSDYKNGAGIPVDAEGNPQIRYYAYGIVRKLIADGDLMIRTVVLRIVQPNAIHPAGPVREEVLTVYALCEWAEEELVPAMQRTEVDTSLDPGAHCRFCPARLICPALRGLYGAAATADATGAKQLSDAELGRQFELMEAIGIYRRALAKEAYRRLLTGAQVPGTKLVEKIADRIWREGAEMRFVNELGEGAFETKLRSPASMEKLSALAKQLVKEWAYQPKTGFTVELASAKRAAVKVIPDTAYADYMKQENE
jgi:hypothetical protein